MTDDSDDASSSILSALGGSKSLPDISTFVPTDECFMEIKKEISDLKQQLAAAHKEVESLSVENSDLKKQLLEQKSQIETLKKICCERGNNSNLSGIMSTKKRQKSPNKKNAISHITPVRLRHL